MSNGVTNSWALNQSTFNKVFEKIRKKLKTVISKPFLSIGKSLLNMKGYHPVS